MMMMGRPQGRGAGGRPQAGQRGGPFMGLSAPVERSKDFRGTLRKLLARLRSERLVLAVVVVLGSISVAFSVIGPKIAGNAMNVIFDGVVGRTLPAGVPKEQIIASLRASGRGQFADMLAATNAVPGVGIDFAALAQILALAVVVYALASHGRRRTSWPASRSGPSTACDVRSRRSSRGCHFGTSTATPTEIF